jgi:hypothetical protein
MAVALAALGVLAADPLPAVEFSADYVTRVNGKARRAQIYVKDDKIRLEHQGGILTDLGYAGVSILRLDKQVVWLLLSKRRQYLTVPLRKDHVPPLTETMDGETARKVVREETLGKYRTTLYEVTVGSGTRAERYYQWVLMEHHLPLRTVSSDRDWAVEYEHVVFSKQQDFFFEVPPKFSEWQPPAPTKPPTEAY